MTPVERRGDFRVAEQRFRLGRRRIGHAEFGLGAVEFGLRKNFLLEQIRGALQIAFRLLAHGGGLVVLRLNFARVNRASNSPAGHMLAGHDEHLFNLAADLGLDDGVQFGAHRADVVFRGNAAFVFGHLRLHSDRRQGFGSRHFRSCARSRSKPNAASSNVDDGEISVEFIFRAPFAPAWPRSNFRRHGPRRVFSKSFPADKSW